MPKHRPSSYCVTDNDRDYRVRAQALVIAAKNLLTDARGELNDAARGDDAGAKELAKECLYLAWEMEELAKKIHIR